MEREQGLIKILYMDFKQQYLDKFVNHLNNDFEIETYLISQENPEIPDLNKYNILVFDVPHNFCPSLISRIQKDFPELILICLCNTDDYNTVRRAFKWGIDDFIPKKLLNEDKINFIREILLNTYREKQEEACKNRLLRISCKLNKILNSNASLQLIMNDILDNLIEIDGIDGGCLYINEDDFADILTFRGLSVQYWQLTSCMDPDSDEVKQLNKGSAVFKENIHITDDNPFSNPHKVKSSTIFPIFKDKKPVAFLKVASRYFTRIPEFLNEFVREIAEHVTDLIMRKHDEKELLKREEMYRTLIENLKEGLGVQDEDGNLIFVNDTFARWLGFSASELLGKPVSDFLASSAQPVLSDDYLLEDHNRYARYEISWKKKNGDVLPTLVTSAPFMGNGGEFMGSLAMISNLSHKKSSENEMKKYTEKLENTLKHKTRDIEKYHEKVEYEILKRKQAEHQLYQLQSLYQNLQGQAARNFKLFSNQMPLVTSIVKNSESVLKTNLEDSQRKHLLSIKTSAMSLIKMIDHVLETSQKAIQNF
ncbi:MAG: PAS domain S-box protein [Vulcanimicrobiota bacterium]